MMGFHHDDFVAHLLEKGGWEIVNLPAIAVHDEQYVLSTGQKFTRLKGEALHSEREPLSVLLELEKSMLPLNFATQYQQMPMIPDGNLVKLSWFGRYPHPPADQGATIYQSWDTASKDGENNDYSACITWLYKDGEYYVLDVYRAKLEFPALRDAVIAQRKKWTIMETPPMVVMEEASAGIGLIQDLKKYGIRIKPIIVKGNKVERLVDCSFRIHGGTVHSPQERTWLADFENELAAFPRGRHDDQVDAMSLFLNWHPYRPKAGFSQVTGLTY